MELKSRFFWSQYSHYLFLTLASTTLLHSLDTFYFMHTWKDERYKGQTINNNGKSINITESCCIRHHKITYPDFSIHITPEDYGNDLKELFTGRFYSILNTYSDNDWHLWLWPTINSSYFKSFENKHNPRLIQKLVLKI